MEDAGPAPKPRDDYEVTGWRAKSPLDVAARAVGAFVWRSRQILLYLLLLGLTIGWLRPILPAFLTSTGILLTVAAVLPITLLMLVVWASDRTETEPIGLVLRTFLAGVTLAVLSAILNQQLAYLPTVLLYALVVGPGEEIFKLLGAYLSVWRHKAFDNAADGIVYGVAAGAGFAAIENITRVVEATPETVWQVVLLRTFLSTPAHALWTGLAGFYLGLAKFVPEHAKALVTKGLLIAVAAHVVFDLLVRGGAVIGIVIAAALNVLLLSFLVFKAHRYYVHFRATHEPKAIVEETAPTNA